MFHVLEGYVKHFWNDGIPPVSGEMLRLKTLLDQVKSLKMLPCCSVVRYSGELDLFCLLKVNSDTTVLDDENIFCVDVKRSFPRGLRKM